MAAAEHSGHHLWKKGVMTTQGSVLPGRITPDAILEALVELHIEHPELPELVVGRLLDADLWRDYTQARLPTADIPQPIREVDLQLRYAPIFELRKGDGSRVAKIGGHVLSYHIVGAYPGWSVFRPELESVLKTVIEKLKAPQFSRIGFRYINIFTPDRHHVGGLADTNIVLRRGDEILTSSVNVNYMRQLGKEHVVTVKIATPDLVGGSVPQHFSLLCDIDVGSKPGVVITTYDHALSWIDAAHDLEKAEFFGILPDDITNKLTPETGGNANV